MPVEAPYPKPFNPSQLGYRVTSKVRNHLQVNYLNGASLLQEMEGSCLQSVCKSCTYIGTQTSPSLLQSEKSSSQSSFLRFKRNEDLQEISGHQAPRWASDFFIEEQPHWLEDLLNEPDTQAHKNHRRSASDTFACLGEAVEGLDIREGTKQKDDMSLSTVVRKDSIHYNVSSQIKFEKRTSSQDDKFKKDPNIAISRFPEKREKDEVGPQNPEGPVEVANSSPSKHPASKTDAKRAKQQSVHRSQFRKLQYISQLERTIQLLRAEGSEISAELEFLGRQNLILSMENKAIKQRLENLTQEHLIKQMEQEMIERELGRFQSLYQLQRKKLIQMPQQHPKMKQKQGP